MCWSESADGCIHIFLEITVEKRMDSHDNTNIDEFLYTQNFVRCRRVILQTIWFVCCSVQGTHFSSVSNDKFSSHMTSSVFYSTELIRFM